jgi:hypothetical protein
MNDFGMYVPPLVVFLRYKMKAELLDGAAPGSIAACHKAGWIQKESFTQCLKDFVRYVKPSKEDPVILTLDGHFSYEEYRGDKVCAGKRGNHSLSSPALYS